MRFLAICFVIALAACSGTAAEGSRVLELQTLNGSGVTGSVTLSPAGEARTLVELTLVPNDHPDMPAHVHPGTCANLVPQPMFPLELFVNGVSRTEIPISMAELEGETVAVNIHHSNDQMQISVACVDLN